MEGLLLLPQNFWDENQAHLTWVKWKLPPCFLSCFFVFFLLSWRGFNCMLRGFKTPSEVPFGFPVCLNILKLQQLFSAVCPNPSRAVFFHPGCFPQIYLFGIDSILVISPLTSKGLEFKLVQRILCLEQAFKISQDLWLIIESMPIQCTPESVFFFSPLLNFSFRIRLRSPSVLFQIISLGTKKI